MPLNNLRDLLIGQLNELYAAERHHMVAIPRLLQATTDTRLADILRAHSDECSTHLSRLDLVFDDLGVRPPTEMSESNGMRGILRDCMELANMTRAEPHVRDAALVALAQHIEHDQIAGYGCARTWVQLLGHHNSASQLQRCLDDERRADRDLTRLAQSLNKAALAPMLA
jgi:ferritin-like metal-binding protein YciE